MLKMINRYLDSWGQKLATRPALSISSNHPRLKVIRKTRHIWLPIGMFIALFLIYGIYENLYQLDIIVTHFHPSLLVTILAIIFGVGFVLICLYGSIYIQNYYIKTTSMSRSNWWIDILVGIVCAWLLPTITSAFLDDILKVQPHISTNQALINKMLGMHGLAFWFIILMSIVFGPIIEEILFRFLLIGPSNFNGYRFEKDLRIIMVAISVIFFAYEHLNPEFSMIDWSSRESVLALIIDGIRYAVMGCVFTSMYLRTDDIRTSITAHIGYNLLGTVIQLGMSFL